MTNLVIEGFLLGVVVSSVWWLNAYEPLFSEHSFLWWVGEVIAVGIFAVGVYVLGRQVNKVSAIVEKELGKDKET